MVANISKNQLNNTPDKGKVNSNQNTSTTSLSSPVSQLLKKDSSEVNDQLNSGSKSLKSIQFFGENENHQNNPTSSIALNSSPSFPPIQRKGSTDHSPKAAGSANKTGLPDGLKSGVEALSGMSLDGVKVHYNSSAPAQLHAHAYAQGTNIHVAPGQEKHLPHEAWHVVQQKQGRVQATKQMKGEVPVNDDAGLEKEADVMGAKAVQMAAKENGGVVQQISSSNNAVAQLGMFDWMKSMYKGAKRMLGFGEEEKKKEKFVGVNPWKTEENQNVINDKYQEKIDEKVKERNHQTLFENLPFNPAIEDTEPAKGQDLSIIPKGKVEGIKKGIVVADGEKGEADNDRKNDLEKHFKEKIRRQELVSKQKHGQGMAEQIAKGGDGNNENVDNFTKDEVAPEAMSQNLMDLVSLTKYDDTASASVLELANGGSDLSDQDMWNLIVVNSKLMSYIKEGMTVNKIIPDETVKHVIKYKQTSADRTDDEKDYDKKRKVTKIGGSVAHEMNYNQGLTGEESTANFGLDYSGYKSDTLRSDGTSILDNQWENRKNTDKELAHSDYVFDAAADEKGRTLKAVPNVFYMKVAIPAVNLPDVKVPVHGYVQNWANNKLHEIQTIMGNPNELLLLATSLGAKNSNEMSESLTKKLAILNLFNERSKVDKGMLTTLTADKKKNKEDPLTNMGMTKPSSRLQTEFGTINQEYHIGLFDVPEGSGLWLKDATGVDTLVGQFVQNPNNSNQIEWGSLDENIINKKLTENSDLRKKK